MDQSGVFKKCGCTIIVYYLYYLSCHKQKWPPLKNRECYKIISTILIRTWKNLMKVYKMVRQLLLDHFIWIGSLEVLVPLSTSCTVLIILIVSQPSPKILLTLSYWHPKCKVFPVFQNRPNLFHFLLFQRERQSHHSNCEDKDGLI